MISHRRIVKGQLSDPELEQKWKKKLLSVMWGIPTNLLSVSREGQKILSLQIKKKKVLLGYDLAFHLRTIVFQKIPFIWRAHYVFGLWSILTLIFSILKLQPKQGDDFHSSLTGSSSQGFPPPCQFNFEFNLCLWCAFHPFMLDVICQFNKYILHSIIQLLMKLMNNIGQRTHPSRAC